MRWVLFLLPLHRWGHGGTGSGERPGAWWQGRREESILTKVSMWAAAKRWSRLWTEKWPLDLVTWKSPVTLKRTETGQGGDGNRWWGVVKKDGQLFTASPSQELPGSGQKAGLQRIAEAGVLCKWFFVQKKGKSGCRFWKLICSLTALWLPICLSPPGGCRLHGVGTRSCSLIFSDLSPIRVTGT